MKRIHYLEGSQQNYKATYLNDLNDESQLKRDSVLILDETLKFV